ncbi:MAG: NAD(P)-dependent glycerol-3-phosphate dehydrogenase [Candidatus Eisenbacteria bacterium]|uniref:Glycerol-3-phosphate dehydrogenase [NAD(P)+] n=1 Tax=Eiseniibacteriota bacterium TaxID=2212470 RepID=A0A956NDA0_UNCEI|nr:NAD(P)-dependent glycerol-3-phosphate dehydrogenase [Candidatus Eisenbacteria bacterium]MCB9462796.1 NAD(P)-dependent glycerol-3-phosphate dehydrogenase [Candidatus Eisenbacteria bacterium]
MTLSEPVVVYGAGSWGTTLALVLAGKGVPVLLWGRDEVQRGAMTRERENRKYLPGIPFPGFIHVVPEGAPPRPAGSVAVLAVPSHGIRELLAAVEPKDGVTWVIATKGLEEGTGYRMSQVVADAFVGSAASSPVPFDPASSPLVTLAGPSLAREVAEGKPTALLAASTSESAAAHVQELFATERFRVYRSSDPIGVELATSLKNGIALAAGIAEGLELGRNTLGALLTRGLAEITRLGVALGAQMETFLGLAGVGDLVTTCTSPLSRNNQLGRLLAQGHSLDAALGKMTMVAEGVRTTRAAVSLAADKGIEVPILAQVERILFHGLDPAEAIDALMTRPLRAE